MLSRPALQWLRCWIVIGALCSGGCLESLGDDCALTSTCLDEEAEASTEGDASIDVTPDTLAESGSASGDRRSVEGGKCASPEECESGYCVDGRCCNGACEGVCERCDTVGAEGICSPVPADTDPDGECMGKSDRCAGACDGHGRCWFPTNEIVCGSTSCIDGRELAETCDGAGACVVSDSSCGLYACGIDRCRSGCNTHADCSAKAYCQAGECRPQKPLSDTCGEPDECVSGFCSGGHCCSTACVAPSSCATGQCLCGGSECSPGSSCVVWYLDQDGDGYPAQSEHDIASCSDRRPPNRDDGRSYYNSTLVQLDCDDADADVHPNQTKFFRAPRKNLGGFDYDCDGKESRQYPNGAQFRKCAGCERPNNVCDVGLGLPNDSCNQLPAAYDSVVAVPCGQMGSLITCRARNTLTCTLIDELSDWTQQGCR